MTVYTVGAVSERRVYRLEQLGNRDEPQLAHTVLRELGGHGAGLSVAAARAGAQVRHIGVVGSDASSLLRQMAAYRIDLTHVRRDDRLPTGHVLEFEEPDRAPYSIDCRGTNILVGPEQLRIALSEAVAGDILLLGLDTSAQREAAEMGRAAGMTVVFAPLHFNCEDFESLFPYLDLICLHGPGVFEFEVAYGLPFRTDTGGIEVMACRGPDGTTLYPPNREPILMVPKMPTGMTDFDACLATLIGYLAAGFDLGHPRVTALQVAAAAAIMQFSRTGGISVIPDIVEVKTFLSI